MSHHGIGERHDAMIRLLTGLGLSSGQIAARLDCSAEFVKRRAHAIGCGPRLIENNRRRSSAASRRVARLTRPWQASLGKAEPKMRAVVVPVAFDHGAARIVRTLRHAAPPPGDNAHLAACLHARGVTLDDLDAHLGVPPAAVIAAIRQQAGLRP